MGRRDKSYAIDLHQQAYNKLTGMQAFGESKKDAMAEGTDRDKIFSFSTYQTYWKHTKYFLAYVKEHYPNCTTLKAAKQYIGEWLQSRVDAGLSAWTVQTEAKALGKLYGIKPGDRDYINPPKRIRAEIKRSRIDTVRDKHFSKTNNEDLIKFAKGTGLRRSELEQIRGRHLMTGETIRSEIKRLEALPESSWTKADRKYAAALKDAAVFNSGYYVLVESGKGGRMRISPIVGPDIDKIVGRFRDTQRDEKVWKYVSSNADIHSYRSDYAVQIYKASARDIKDIPFDKVNSGTGRKYQSEVYTCRKDESKKKLDKRAMLMCSKALGHNRIEIVANNYIRGL